MTPELGCGLDGLLRRRQGNLSGILNGADYDEWNSSADAFIKHAYSADNLRGKLANKTELQNELGLPASETIPLFGSINRLVDQKGVDIQLVALEQMLSAEMQFILLGSGEAKYEQGYRELARRYPTKVAVRIGHDQGLSHRIEAGCDFFLLPSRFEPCGLNQMYSLRYGTIPIVRATGGLDDTVVDITENAENANGIKFSDYSPAALAKAIRKAFALYAEPELHRHYQRNGMAADFSWERTARVYLDLYQKVLAG
jgi:starch synthase